MEKIIVCSCIDKPQVNTDSPLVEAIRGYGKSQGFDLALRDGNAIKHGRTWYVAYYESDLEPAGKPGKTPKKNH